MIPYSSLLNAVSACLPWTRLSTWASAYIADVSATNADDVVRNPPPAEDAVEQYIEARNKFSEDNDIEEWLVFRYDGLSTRQIEAVHLKDGHLLWPASLVLGSDVRRIWRWQMPSECGFMDETVDPYIDVALSDERFKASFDQVTGGALDGLDWSNVVCAGGMVLGALLVDRPVELWSGADIDLFVFGLNVDDASRKVAVIMRTFESNVGRPTLAVTTSRTITVFAAGFPLRLQIVLRLACSAVDIISRFDLDVCAMAWDGRTLAMLPEAARALETGYNVFRVRSLGMRTLPHFGRFSKYSYRGFGHKLVFPSDLRPAMTATVHTSRLAAADVATAYFGTLGGGSDTASHPGRPVTSAWTFQAATRSGCEPPLATLNGMLRLAALWTVTHANGIALSTSATFLAEYDQGANTTESVRDFDWLATQDLELLREHLDCINVRDALRATRTLGGDGAISMPNGSTIAHSRVTDTTAALEGRISHPIFIQKRLYTSVVSAVEEAMTELGRPCPQFLVPYTVGHQQADWTDSDDAVVLAFWERSGVLLWEGLHPSIDRAWALLDALRRLFYASLNTTVSLQIAGEVLVEDTERSAVLQVMNERKGREREALLEWMGLVDM